jgi:VWFA-related protein
MASAVLSAHAAEPKGSAVRVTAVVTNARGQPIAGLRAGDFQITVDGKPHTVDEIEFRDGNGSAPRVFALVVDEFHVDAESSAPVRDALLTFVETHLRPDDLAVVFKPLDALTSIHPTADRQAIRESIGMFEGRKGDYAPRTDFERRYMAQAPNAVVSARAQIVSSALRTVAARLGEMRGKRAAIVLVSDGFARRRVERSLPANLLSAIRIANRGDVPVYVFSPAGPPASAAAPDDKVEPAEAALRTIAAQTGGEFNGGLESFANGLARMVRELDAHYVLTYQPPHGDDGRFHSVEVNLKRADARVRTRAGYVAPLSAELRARASAPPAPIRVLKRSSLIQSWSGVTKGPDGKARVIFTWEPARVRPGSARPEPSALVVTASTPEGTVLFDGSLVAVDAPVPPEGSNRAEFTAPSGRVLVDVKILDAKGVVLDTDARDLEVPNLQTTRATILPPAVLRSTSAREFRAMSEDPSAPPVPSREFRRTERLLLRVPAYDASGAPAKVSATLLNRWRHPMRALPAMADSVLDGITQFDVPLAPLAPGEYTIRLSVGALSEHVTFRVGG